MLLALALFGISAVSNAAQPAARAPLPVQSRVPVRAAAPESSDRPGFSVMKALPDSALPPVQPQAALPDEDPSVAEIQASHARQAQAAEAAAAINPANMAVDAATRLQAQYQLQAQQLASHPALQRMRGYFTDPKISANLAALLTESQVPGRRKNLLIAELALFIFILVFRSWRLSRVDHWGRKLWVRAYSHALHFALALTLVPILIFGESYSNLLLRTFELLTG